MTRKLNYARLLRKDNGYTDEQTGLNTRNWSVMNNAQRNVVLANPEIFEYVSSEPVRKKRPTQTFGTITGGSPVTTGDSPSTFGGLASSGAISTRGLPSQGLNSGGFIAPHRVANSGFKYLKEKAYIADLISPNRVDILTKSNIRDMVYKPQ
jgi:hypothetical protein